MVLSHTVITCGQDDHANWKAGVGAANTPIGQPACSASGQAKCKGLLPHKIH